MTERDSSARATKSPSACPRCGTEGHSASDCRFKDKQCYYCKKKGHIARICHKKLNKLGSGSPKISYVKDATAPDTSDTSGNEDDLIKNVVEVSQVKEGEQNI